MRHPVFVTENDPRMGLAVTTHAREYPSGFRIPFHAHGSDQLVYASRGVMEITSGENVWILPPHFGLWVPARRGHSIRMLEHVAMRTLYLRPGTHKSWTACTVFHVTPFLRELIFDIVRIGRIRMRNRLEGAYREILLSQLAKATPVPTGVALPRDSRALAVAEVVLKDPGQRRTLVQLCREAGASVRTIQRAYQREVGQDFESWRQQVRLMKAVHLLVAGLSVKEVTFAVGYQDPSSFVALFRATFGQTPKAWILNLRSRWE